MAWGDRATATRVIRSEAYNLVDWKLRGQNRLDMRTWIANPYRTTAQIQAKIDWMKTLPDREDGNAKARIHPAVLDEIREQYGNQTATVKELAVKHGISEGYIYAILGGRSRRAGSSTS